MNRIPSSPLLLALSAIALLLGCRAKDEMHDSVPLPPGTDQTAPPPSKVVFLYVPGLDAEVVERGMRDEYLPNLRRLRVDGTQVAIAASNRAEFWSGRAGATPLVPEVKETEASALLPDLEPTRLPDHLPVLEPVAPFTSFIDGMATAGVEVIALGAPYPTVVEDLPHKRVITSGLPAATFGAGSFTFIREGSTTSPSVREVPGGRVIDMPASTSSRDEATFSIDLLGPRLAVDASPLAARFEIRTSIDRMRAVVRSQDDSDEVLAGHFSKPIRLRFQLAKDVVLYARTRVYLRPTGRELLEAYIEPIDFTPVLPPKWVRVASPKDYAGEVERAHGDLPSFGSALPRAAIDLGLLGFKDGVAALDSDFAAARRALTSVLAEGGFRVLAAEFDLVDEAAWLATRGGAADRADEVVEFQGRRVPRSKFVEAAAGAVDTLLGEILARIDKRDRRESITLLVASNGPAGKPGLASMSRLAYDVESGRPMSDVVATAFALIGIPNPAGIEGKALPLGNAIEPLPESMFEKRPVREPAVADPDAGAAADQTSKK